MDGIHYLTQRRSIYFFRRRVPSLSTCLSPVMLSLGTTDRRAAFRLCVQLTAHMDRMLDTDTHINLPDANVTAFFQAELRRVLASLRAARVVERMDGSLTGGRAVAHRLEAYALRSLVEDGLRDVMPDDRLNCLPEGEQAMALKIHSKLFRQFISPAFNQDLLHRARPGVAARDLSVLEKLELRWAAVEAKMAAHHAVANVPLHNAESACRQAEAMLRAHYDSNTVYPLLHTPTDVLQADQPAKVPQYVSRDQPHAEAAPKPRLTQGVALIVGRVTGHTIHIQRDQASAQPEEVEFNGHAKDATIERSYGQDLYGTAVRMCRKQTAKQGTKDQKLKTVALFIYITGVQLVTDISSHHIETFARALAKNLPKAYWKSPRQLSMTFKELRETTHAIRDAEIGLSASSIERHVTTLKSIMAYAAREGHHVPFLLKISELVPVDPRTDTEKRSVFTDADFQKVFAHPLWSGSKSKARRHEAGDLVLKDHHYWINIMLALTGARRGEIAGLLTTDILEDDGIHFAYIRPNQLRGLKRNHCKRRIPLHPQLLELGFLDFVTSVRDRRATVLFPVCQ